MELKHTPGPWRVGKNCRSMIFEANNGDTVATVETFATPESVIAANARRIVACVNYCEGASTEELEKAATGGIDYLTTVIKQRDELLAAAIALLDSEPLLSNEAQALRDAISRATKKTHNTN